MLIFISILTSLILKLLIKYFKRKLIFFKVNSLFQNISNFNRHRIQRESHIQVDFGKILRQIVDYY
jgi:hypothetical protein